MRAGLAFSLVLHLALLVWGFVLFAKPAPFVPVPPDAIMVELVPAAAAQEAEPGPEQRTSAEAPPPAQQQREAPADAKTTAASGPKIDAKPPAGAVGHGVPDGPKDQSAATGGTSEQGRSSAPSEQPDPPPTLLVYGPTTQPIPELPLVSNGTPNAVGGYDAPASSTAKLSGADVAAFRQHLQQCWKLPAGIGDAPKLKVVLRIGLQPNGSLSGSPMLIEASASPHGPALVAAATSALRKCQPYGFLPAAKYQEWKLLDLSFSPQGLSGG